MVKRGKGKAAAMPAGIAAGTTTCVGISVIGAMLLSWFVMLEKVDHNKIGFGVMLIQTVSTAVGCVLASGLIKHRKAVVHMAVCGCYYCMLLLFGIAFGNGIQGMGVTAIMVFLGGVLASIPALIGGRSGVRMRKISPYR